MAFDSDDGTLQIWVWRFDYEWSDGVMQGRGGQERGWERSSEALNKYGGATFHSADHAVDGRGVASLLLETEHISFKFF